MARIRIAVPETFGFSTIIPVRITDLNYGGHVGNDTILSLLHEARMQFLQHHGLSEMNFSGVSLIMSDVGIEFRSELFYGHNIRAYVTATEFSRVGFDLCYQLVNETTEAVIAVAKTGMICFDYTSRKVTSVPEGIKEKMDA